MDFKCDELILGKKDADSRALTLLGRSGEPPRPPQKVENLPKKGGEEREED